MNKKHKIIFAGTSDFAIPSLKKLTELDFIGLELIITQPDKPAGRKKEPLPSPIKKFAQSKNLELSQPQKIIELKDRLREVKPDLGIVVSYGQFIPQEILDIPKHGWLNIHPSLLPKYRGPSPIQNTILNQDRLAGTTLMKVDSQMDHGPIIAQEDFEINKMTDKLLGRFLAECSAEMLENNLANYLEGKIKPQPQDHNQATFTKIINKQDGKINWAKSVDEIGAQIRAYTIWPGTYTIWNSKRLKIISARATEIRSDLKPGQVKIKNDKLYVACGDKFIEVFSLQLEGKKEMSADIFIQGYRNIDGQILS